MSIDRQQYFRLKKIEEIKKNIEDLPLNVIHETEKNKLLQQLALITKEVQENQSHSMHTKKMLENIEQIYRRIFQPVSQQTAELEHQVKQLSLYKNTFKRYQSATFTPPNSDSEENSVSEEETVHMSRFRK